jgi:PKHD-type hydroxylase
LPYCARCGYDAAKPIAFAPLPASPPVFLRIDNVLDPETLRQATAQVREAAFEPGQKTAGWNARMVKNNLQLGPGNPAGDGARKLLTEALLRNPQFDMAARPKMMRPLTIARYEPGMEYGWHIDDPLMGGPPALRTDVAFTMFLGQPEDCDGGELVIKLPQGEQAFKLPAGSLLLYPASTLHRVASVTRGVRLVALSWVQSLVRDDTCREILYDLDLTRRELFEREGKSAGFDRLNRSFANLVRMWVEP